MPWSTRTLSAVVATVVITGLSGLATAAFAPRVPAVIPIAPAALAGTYDCGGVNPDGSDYTIQLTVTARDDIFSLNWAHQMEGVGLRHGELLVSSFIGPGMFGVVVYRIDEGELDGRWAAYGDSRVFRESCRKGRPA